MDGNGRWAAARGWPRTAGHRAGIETVRRIVEAAPGVGIKILTIYAFSSDNWKRPATEVASLMKLLRTYLKQDTSQCIENGVRVSVIGRRDRLSLSMCGDIEAAENATAAGSSLHLRIALDYSSRDAILAAVGRMRHVRSLTRETFERLLVGSYKGASGVAKVDLLIRTGGEQRLSDFLLWECAYAELYFSPVMWPDFAASDLEKAVAAFGVRERRFGALPAPSIAS